MKENPSEGEDDSDINPHLKEQDKGIIEAFSRANHRVLTNNEIAENVSLSSRQVRRRLVDLADRGVIGKRKAGGVNLAWLEASIKEPITVQYPLLRYVRDHSSVMIFLAGIVMGIPAVLLLLAAAITIGYDVPTIFFNSNQLFIYGVGAAVFSALFILASIVMAAVGYLVRNLGIHSQIAS